MPYKQGWAQLYFSYIPNSIPEWQPGSDQGIIIR